MIPKILICYLVGGYIGDVIGIKGRIQTRVIQNEDDSKKKKQK